MSFAALVTDREHEAARQLLLDVEVPVFVVQVAAQPIDGPGGDPLPLKLGHEWLDRVREVFYGGRGKRVITRRGLVRRAEVVVLARAVVNPEARADGGFPLEDCG